MKQYDLLPPINSNIRLHFPHFPTALHGAVFRLWETVEKERIAKGLELPLETICKAAADMGLPPQKHMENWPKRGYITTIRNAWHILPYDALLRVLDMTEEELATLLKEDDFLYVKLGKCKPLCQKIVEEPLTLEQEKQLAGIKAVMENSFSQMFQGKAPFDFFESIPDRISVADDEGIRMVFSYCGLYGKALDEDIGLSYPEPLLQKYAQMGVNAIWLPTVLYQVSPFPFDKKYSKGYEKRREKLRELVSLAGKYGIRVFLYLDEPRCMPIEFFRDHPELLGRVDNMYGALCTSNEEVLDYLENGVKSLCQAVPGLGGFFLITASENLTHCKVRPKSTCQKCQDIPTADMISKIICTIAKAVDSVDKNIRVISWDWSWDSIMTREEQEQCMASLPKNVIIQTSSEYKKKIEVGGISGEIVDYSISQPGPGDRAKWVWETAAKLGHEVSAKVQVNNTWECSTVAFLPVFDLIREHMTNLKGEGVNHLMLSWSLGGYPSINFKVATECFRDPSEENYDRLLQSEFGENAALIKRVAKKFSDAFQQFPFCEYTAYRGPQNAGPSNLLYPEPTGLESTMTCYCFDDLDSWRGIYPTEVFKEQFYKLSQMWAEGLSELEDLEDCEFKRAAYVGYGLFRSSYLQIAFIMNRQEKNATVLTEILDEERELACSLYELMCRDATIGYEAANHYYFNKGLLAEKVINCDYIKSQLK